MIQDPLQGGTIGQQAGGSFGTEGYMPGVGDGHVFYKLPSTVRQGYAEFEVKGMTTAGMSKDKESKQGFFGMYDGRGIEEPAQYFRDFKSNFNRFAVAWNNQVEKFQCTVTTYNPSPERLDAARAVDDKRDWSKEPKMGVVAWDPNRWYQFRVEWKDKAFKLFVDGNLVWEVSGPHDYAPADHRVWLGSVPGHDVKYVNQVAGIAYRNFKLGASD